MERSLLCRIHNKQRPLGVGQTHLYRCRFDHLSHNHSLRLDTGFAVWPYMGCRVMETLEMLLIGATAMGSLVTALFFFRFWARTHDTFFLFFSAAFLIEAVSRV